MAISRLHYHGTRCKENIIFNGIGAFEATKWNVFKIRRWNFLPNGRSLLVEDEGRKYWALSCNCFSLAAFGVRTANNQQWVIASIWRRFFESWRFCWPSGRPFARWNLFHWTCSMLRQWQTLDDRPSDWPERVLVPVRLGPTCSTISSQCWHVRHPIPQYRSEPVPEHRRGKFGVLFTFGEFFVDRI